jgi:hypothetical protein
MAARDENATEVENRTVASEKSMLTVLWNLHGFHVVTMLPPGTSFIASSLINENFIPFFDKFSRAGRSPEQRKPVVRSDNAPTRNER